MTPIVALATLAACGGGGNERDYAAAPAEGCTQVSSPAILGRNHVQPTVVPTYNSTPPTSGDHYPSPARVGIYADSIPNGVQVHNLEHGHVMIQYHDITEDQQRELEAAVRADPASVLMAPYPLQGVKLALTSWGKIQTCTEWSNGVVGTVRAFIQANRNHAPETLP